MKNHALRWLLAPASVSLLAHTVGGLAYGLALTRTLFEADPLRFGTLGKPTTALGIAALVALLVAVIALLLSKKNVPPTFSPLWLAFIHILAPSTNINITRGIILLIGAPLLTVALWRYPPQRESRSFLPCLIVGGIALLGYLATLQQTIGRADTFEFQVTAPVLGVAHPTGYPLYILLGKLFSLLPIGQVATRVNLTSVLAATVATCLLFETARRTLKLDTLTAGLAALTFAFGPTFWSQAVIAEVYTLHNAFVAAILGGTLWLLTHPEAAQDKQVKGVFLLFTLTGLSFANHLTTVLLLPALVLTLALTRPHLTWRQWGAAIGLLAAGLLLYVYIPLRWPALHNGQTMSLSEFIAWVTGQRFGGALQLGAWLHDPNRWDILWRLITTEYHWMGLALAGFGLAALAFQNWRAALITVLVYAAYAFYGLNYLVPDISVFLIPLFLIQALWMGFGVHAVLSRLPDRLRFLQATVLAIFALLPMATLWEIGPIFDWQDEQALEAWGRGVLSLPLAQDAAILADSEKVAPLEYLHRIEGNRPDLQIVVLGTEAEYQANLRARLSDGQTVYLARYLPGLEGEFHLRSVGPLIEVSTAPLEQIPPLDTSLDHEWADGIRLLGYRASCTNAPAGQTLGITLYWTLDAPVPHNYAIRLRLVTSDNEIAWETSPAYAVSDRYPTAAWKPGEVIPDYHTLTLPYSLPPASYRLEVALEPPFGGTPALLTDGTAWASIETITVSAPALPPTELHHRTAITLPGWVLLNVDAPESAPAGGTAPLILTWHRSPSAGPLRVTLEAGSSRLPISLDRSGSPYVQTVHQVEVPTTESLIWQLQADEVHCGWLQPPTTACALATTDIAATMVTDALANFDNFVVLTNLEIERDRLQPGESLDVALTWQSLRTTTEDYTVFVHLLGPDGQLHGQVDAWPIQGTYPTSAWSPGETLTDRYQVPLDPDAPPGSYQVEIGFYLLATNTRLPVLSPDGTPIDDKILIGGLIVAIP